jgi:hypothetical protein
MGVKRRGISASWVRSVQGITSKCGNGIGRTSPQIFKITHKQCGVISLQRKSYSAAKKSMALVQVSRINLFY